MIDDTESAATPEQLRDYSDGHHGVKQYADVPTSCGAPIVAPRQDTDEFRRLRDIAAKEELQRSVKYNSHLREDGVPAQRPQNKRGPYDLTISQMRYYLDILGGLSQGEWKTRRKGRHIPRVPKRLVTWGLVEARTHQGNQQHRLTGGALEIRDHWESKVTPFDEAKKAILDAMQDKSVLIAREAAEIAGCSPQAARKLIQSLEADGAVVNVGKVEISREDSHGGRVTVDTFRAK